MKLFAWLLACTLTLPAQKLAYEVTSVKPNKDGGFAVRIGMGAGGRFTASNVSVRQLVLQAYGLQEFQLNGGPSWVNDERFDIEARPEAGLSAPTREQTQEMLQSLLADRFQLKVRRETKDLPVYNLVVAKSGPKLKPSADQTPLGPPTGPPPAPGAGGAARGMMRMGPGNLSASAVPITFLVRQIGSAVSRPVNDKTGLTALYDIEFHWTPERMPAGLPAGLDLPAIDPNGPSIFVALQEQLGLKLDSTTGPVETIVIESIQKPTEN